MWPYHYRGNRWVLTTRNPPLSSINTNRIPNRPPNFSVLFSTPITAAAVA